MERNLCSSKLEIRGIPRKDFETKKNLTEYVQKAGKSLNITVLPSDIRDIYRINTKSETSKPIIVEFISTNLKEDILKSVKMYNRTNKDKFSNINLHLDGPSTPVFISECLTQKTKKLFATARIFARKNNYRYCWTSYGKIYLRKADGGEVSKIKYEHDLKNIKQK
jgi:hypothetical protein